MLMDIGIKIYHMQEKRLEKDIGGMA